MDPGKSTRIAIVGAGLMGHGIALEFAAAGHDVMLHDVSDEILEKAGKAAADECQARDSCRGEEWYRRAVLEVLVSRMARKAVERAR